MQPPGKITPFLWFDRNAEDAAEFYKSVFETCLVHETVRCPEGTHGPAGSVLTIRIEIEGQQLVLLNGGPYFKLTEAFSLSVSCATQAEIDRLWTALSADGGATGQCGWLKDKFGVSWQIVPSTLTHVLRDPDPKRAARAMAAVLTMTKLDIAKIEATAG